jgi:hypothetical protein
MVAVASAIGGLVSIDKTPDMVSLAERHDKLVGIKIDVVLPDCRRPIWHALQLLLRRRIIATTVMRAYSTRAGWWCSICMQIAIDGDIN